MVDGHFPTCMYRDGNWRGIERALDSLIRKLFRQMKSPYHCSVYFNSSRISLIVEEIYVLCSKHDPANCIVLAAIFGCYFFGIFDTNGSTHTYSEKSKKQAVHLAVASTELSLPSLAQFQARCSALIHQAIATLCIIRFGNIVSHSLHDE